MIKHLIGAEWVEEYESALPIFNPATGEVIDEVPIAGRRTLNRAIESAAVAAVEWANVPVMARVQLMFRYRELLDQHFEELATIVTLHHGKTLEEARGEVRRGIEVVDFACGAPTLLQGRSLRQVNSGIDQDYYRFPLGVVGGITPFNFPVMIPLWMFPLAIVAGNTFVLKPSEQTPLGVVRLAELFLEAGFPPGVFNVVHGARAVVEGLCNHEKIDAVSFVGSERVARGVYQMASANGKRVQAAGGAKNHIVVMPDADLDVAVPAVLNSAFGNAGERCLAGSIVVGVGSTHDELAEVLAHSAQRLVVGPGDRPGTDIGPMIREEHRRRVLNYVDTGRAEGAQLVLDGRNQGPSKGFYMGPTILGGVSDVMTVGREEIFGPVLGVGSAADIHDAIAQANRMSLGNMAAIFTSSGKSARTFRESVQAGMIGVNVGVAQPFAFYPFSGWKNSFFGDLHPHGEDAVQFYTRKKVVVSRW